MLLRYRIQKLLFLAELRMLQEIRHELEVDRLHGAAIEAGARARFRTLT